MESVRMIHVLAFITAQPGRRADILAAYRDNLPTVLAEEGCIAYEASIDATAADSGYAPVGPDTFVVVERWTSLETLRAHGASAHMQAYVAKTRPWVAHAAVHVLHAA
jgi:quinol monooxygenase YgiN